MKKYTEKEIKEIISSIVILIDTAEKKFEHIVLGLKSLNIPYELKKLNYGDYSFYIPRNERLGILDDVYFDDECVIERKNGLDELSGNMAQNRERFENEFKRANREAKSFTLMVEDASYEGILTQQYRTMLKPAGFFSSLITFEQRYNVRTVFVSKQYAFKFMYAHFYYYLRERLKGQWGDDVNKKNLKFYDGLGLKIQSIRKEKKITKKFMAHEMNISLSALTNIERGKQNVYSHQIVKIAEILGVEVSELLK